ncbi:MAG: hypothetical protein JNK82_02925 [Myxococcaceae bacterium]|nr:hypothetical protein [Myxococcaceae bacterium]
MKVVAGSKELSAEWPGGAGVAAAGEAGGLGEVDGGVGAARRVVGERLMWGCSARPWPG